MSTIAAFRPRSREGLPPAVRLGWSRGLLETRQLLRDREAFFFTIAFPVLILVLFNAMFDRPHFGDVGVTVAQVFTAGIITLGITAAAYQTLAIGIAQERADGTLKRLRGLPMPPFAYFIGKIVQVGLVTAVEVTLLLGVAVAFFDLDLPSDGRRWAVLGAVSLLGLACFTLLGIAASSLPRTGRNATAVVVPPLLVAQFISGVFVMYHEVPAGLQQVAALFPLKWLAQGLRSVFLPDTFLRFEPAGSWETGLTLAVLAGWTLLALMLCLLSFRWGDRSE